MDKIKYVVVPVEITVTNIMIMTYYVIQKRTFFGWTTITPKTVQKTNLDEVCEEYNKAYNLKKGIKR